VGALDSHGRNFYAEAEERRKALGEITKEPGF